MGIYALCVMDRFSCIMDDWFLSEHPVSFNEIIFSNALTCPVSRAAALF